MVTAISDIRTVPVGEDLTTEDLKLSILRGLERMFRVDKKRADGEEFEKGEWAVLKSDGTVERPGASPVANTYLVFAGSDRFDAHATGQVTLVMNSPIIVKTNQFDTGETYAVGDNLTVKSLGTGFAGVTKAGGAEAVLARVHEVGEGYLVYEVLTR